LKPKEDLRLKTLQTELAAWTLHNFGITCPERMVLGIAEEIQEFFDAREYAWDISHGELEDSLVDIVMFTCNLCNSCHLSFQTHWNNSLLDDVKVNDVNYERKSFMVILGRLSHHTLKLQQCIRGDNELHMDKIIDNIENLLRLTRCAYNVHFGRPEEYVRVGLSPKEYDFTSAILRVWSRVKTRDWRKYV
jgi:hypothetical protein